MESIGFKGVILLIYTVTLNPSIDYIVQVENFKQGGLNRCIHEDIKEGGKGINVSIVLNNLGIETKALGFIAGFTGREIEDRITKRGIENAFVVAQKGLSRINIKVQGKNETEINGMGPFVSENDFKKLLMLMDSATENDMFIFSGSTPQSTINDMYERLCLKAAEKNIPFVVDTIGSNLLSTLKYKPLFVKPNKKELEDIFNAKIETDEGAIAYGKKLQSFEGGGARNVIISMGKDGAVLLCEDGRIIRKKAPKGRQVNTVGSGDSMVAGFAAGIIMYEDYERAFALGVAAGSACAFETGMPSKESIFEVLEKVK